MTPDQRLLAVGIYLTGALYLTGCFVVSLFVQHGNGWKYALASMAACYVAYAAQVMASEARFYAVCLVVLSQLLGALAGVNVFLGG